MSEVREGVRKAALMLSSLREDDRAWLLARMDWYCSRAWIAVTPVRALWWEHGDLTRPPLVWDAPAGTVAPPSDPRPAGPTAGSWKTGGDEVDWRRRTRDGRLGRPTVTVVDGTGAPLALPTVASRRTDNGFVVDLPAGVTTAGVTGADGPVALTFHTHEATFDGQENLSLVGRGVIDGERLHVHVDRALADWGVPRSRLRAALTMAGADRRLRPRLPAEAARRGTSIPTLAELEAVAR